MTPENIHPRRIGGRVYVISDGKVVKIGVSSRGKCVGRFREIKKAYGFEIANSYVTDRRLDYRVIEKIAHGRLIDKWLHHEFFEVSFHEAVSIVECVISTLDQKSFGGITKDNHPVAPLCEVKDNEIELQSIPTDFNSRRRQRGKKSGDLSSRVIV